LLGHLAGLSRAMPTDMSHGLAHHGQYRLGTLETFWCRPDHNGQRRIDGTTFTTGYRCVDVFTASGMNAFGKLLGSNRGDGAHVDDQSAGLEPFDHTAFTEQDFFHVRSVGHDGDDDI